MPDRTVSHLRYGLGVVVDTRHRELELQVRFNDGMVRWVRREEIRESETAETLFSLQVGDRVVHRLFGLGRVVDVVPEDDDLKVTVDFDYAGRRVVKQRFARLETCMRNSEIGRGKYGGERFRATMLVGRADNL